MKILGIETSCDETAIAVIEADGSLEHPTFKLLGSAVHSQVKIHEQYGGVFPTLAKREHIKNLPIVLKEALTKADTTVSEMDAIAVTVGPGLEPALWTGITFAQELSERHGIPLIPTNHMEGHIASVLLSEQHQGMSLEFPVLALLISGGHTELVLMKSWTEKEIIGKTKDDAVGEAFDKVARMLGLHYPGGPLISKLATQARTENLRLETEFPRPMLHSGDYDFSFSGLKTAVLYFIRSLHNPLNPPYLKGETNADAFERSGPPLKVRGGLGGVMNEEMKKKIAREFEDAVTHVLISKSKKAIEEYNPATFVIGGGVIANDHIRSEFEHTLGTLHIPLLIPEKSLTTDNAVMIAIAGYFAHLTNEHLELKAQGNLQIT